MSKRKPLSVLVREQSVREQSQKRLKLDVSPPVGEEKERRVLSLEEETKQRPARPVADPMVDEKESDSPRVDRLVILLTKSRKALTTEERRSLMHYFQIRELDWKVDGQTSFRDMKEQVLVVPMRKRNNLDWYQRNLRRISRDPHTRCILLMSKREKVKMTKWEPYLPDYRTNSIPKDNLFLSKEDFLEEFLVSALPIIRSVTEQVARKVVQTFCK